MEIAEKFEINPGNLERIDKFKKKIGDRAFQSILQGAPVDVPLDEKEFVDLMMICLDDMPEGGWNTITYSEGEEILSFFVKPFAGKSLKQAKSILAGISSLFQDMNPEQLKTVMASISSLKKNGISLDVSNSQTEISKEEKNSIQD